MKRSTRHFFIRMLAMCIVVGTVCVVTVQAQDKSQKTIAILYFENNSVVDKEKLEPLKKGLVDMLITEMSKVKGIKVVERQRIQSIVEELNLNETDMVEQETSQKMGKLLGAKVMLFGGFSNLFKDKFRIDVRIIKTETGETIKAEEETGELNDFLPMLQSLVKKIANELEVKLSSAEENSLEASEGNFSGYITHAKALSMEDEGRKLEKIGKKVEALDKIENAKAMYQKAVDESKYEGAVKKVDEMTKLLVEIRKTTK